MRRVIGIVTLLVLLVPEAGAVLPQRPLVRPNTYTIPAALESLLPISPPKPMPRASFQDPSGAPVSFARFRGHRVMAFFWSASCVPCLKTMPELNQMAEHYGGKALFHGTGVVRRHCRRELRPRYGLYRLRDRNARLRPCGSLLRPDG